MFKVKEGVGGGIPYAIVVLIKLIWAFLDFEIRIIKLELIIQQL